MSSRTTSSGVSATAASSSSKRVSGERGRGVRKSGVQRMSFVSASSSSPSRSARAAAVRLSHGSISGKRPGSRQVRRDSASSFIGDSANRTSPRSAPASSYSISPTMKHNATSLVATVRDRDRTVPCLDRLFRLLFPADPVQRALTVATMSASLSTGLFYSVSALYFTRVIGLEATTVGLGLTIAGRSASWRRSRVGTPRDRVGADRLQLWANAVQGLALLAYVLADAAVAFTLVACVAVGSRSLQGTAKATVQARWFASAERVEIRARLRVITNVFIGIGTVLAGAALLVDTAAAYQATWSSSACSPQPRRCRSAGLRGRVDGFAARMDIHLVPDRVPGPSPLRDRTYVAVGGPELRDRDAVRPDQRRRPALDRHPHRGARGGDLAAAGAQHRASSRSSRSAPRAAPTTSLLAGRDGAARQPAARGRLPAVRRRRAASAWSRRWPLLLLAELLGSWAEIWCEAGGWGLAFELADPLSAGRYQGLSQTGYSLAGMVAPALVTATAVDHGMPAGRSSRSSSRSPGGAVGVVAGGRRAGVRRRSRWWPSGSTLTASL